MPQFKTLLILAGAFQRYSPVMNSIGPIEPEVLVLGRLLPQCVSLFKRRVRVRQTPQVEELNAEFEIERSKVVFRRRRRLGAANGFLAKRQPINWTLKILAGSSEIVNFSRLVWHEAFPSLEGDQPKL
jgi:hypothetical protein